MKLVTDIGPSRVSETEFPPQTKITLEEAQDGITLVDSIVYDRFTPAMVRGLAQFRIDGESTIAMYERMTARLDAQVQSLTEENEALKVEARLSRLEADVANMRMAHDADEDG